MCRQQSVKGGAPRSPSEGRRTTPPGTENNEHGQLIAEADAHACEDWRPRGRRAARGGVQQFGQQRVSGKLGPCRGLV
jgi:hypothetical protein